MAFVGLLALVVDTFTSSGSVAKRAKPVLTIEYRSDGASDTPVADPSLEVVNTSEQPVNLDAVTVRYYLSAPAGSQYTFNCVEAAVHCSNITGTIDAPASPTPGAGRYLQIGFTPGAGILAPGQSSLDISLQIYRLDHQTFNQDADRSFNADDADYTPEKVITGYLDGALVWGTEPDGQSVSSSPSSISAQAASPAPSSGTPSIGTLSSDAPSSGASTTGSPVSAPPGIVFDSFHYTGSDDPALGEHGWGIRTGAGGPGINDTWSASGVSFPAADGAQGGQVLQLRAATDGTKAGTTQAELESTGMRFLNGTFAARVHFSGQPTSGKTGDPINEAYYLISPEAQSGYSELDDEYMPIGWGDVKGPILDTTSWFDDQTKDRATSRTTIDLNGWHTLILTAADGKVTYSVDGKPLYTSSGKYVPRTPMSVNFNAWFGDLFASGQRAWDMQVNWFFASDKALSPADVDASVNGLYAQGSLFVNTMSGS
ncbi:cellulose binding domain-containing protein [Catenulispora pinisilvae]|uniref:cellulose binding domain-containing protein n=1 Tax=Catenulispora pinisilvae TaxID=2705253 RepID=UPI001891DFEC|nr:cellulose binding domain-containing protein [Catenulispora pinisilvae]